MLTTCDIQISRADSDTQYRYTILLFKQPENFSVAASTLIQPNSSFEGFNISAFASSVGLGNPIAGTYFLEGPAGSTVTPSSSASTSVATAMPSAISVSTVKQAFGEAGVVPDVTTSFSPVALLDVAYTSANSPIYVNPGGNLTTPRQFEARFPAFCEFTKVLYPRN